MVDSRFPPKLARMFEGSYNCGWLMSDSNDAYIIKWGNSKNKDAAKKLMDNVLEKQGERQVLFYDKEIPIERSKANIIYLTTDIHNDIKSAAEKWH